MATGQSLPLSRHSFAIAQRSGKLIHLEAARGIASIVVMFYHVALAYFPNVSEHVRGTPLLFFFNGSLAVYFFFVLSGFVLSVGFCKNFDLAKLTASAIKRLPRLWLLVAISLLAGLIIIKLGGLELARQSAAYSGSQWLANFGNARIPDDANFGIVDALRQSIFVFLFREQYYYNANAWTMYYEFWGSMVVFLMIPILVLMQLRRLSFLAVLTPGILLLIFLFYFQMPQISAFVIGSLIAFFCVTLGENYKLARWQKVVLICLIVPGAILGSDPSTFFALISAAAILTFLVLVPKSFSKVSGPLGAKLGDVSFALYLVHLLVILGPGNLILISSGSIWVAATASVLLSIALAVPFAYIDRVWMIRINTVFNAERLKGIFSRKRTKKVVTSD